MANYSEHGGVTFWVYGDASDMAQMLRQAELINGARHFFSSSSPHSILELLGSLAGVAVPVAGIIVAWLHNRRKGSIEVVKKDGSKISLQGLTESQVAAILAENDISNFILDARNDESDE
ncbi:hypothetical protein HQ395_13655 [Aeromonas hydrophila]|uniref:effector-associated constant component EACC1 n=1 Tax=Aeromonas hydrophila TaxID=644 RepID=UPI001C0439F8|nr:hypothetical protein [Aeromonas hydrophila]QWL79729.1 hypothetical protein HQ395_13655 [Aeromonas hydrophila]